MFENKEKCAANYGKIKPNKGINLMYKDE